MIIAVYKRNRPKDRWMLHSLDKDKSAEEAKNKCKILEESAKKGGLEKAEFAFQIFPNELHIPEFLKEIKPEKLIYN